MIGQELKSSHHQSAAVACPPLLRDGASLLPNTVNANSRGSTKVAAHPAQLLKCPRCDSPDTKFCYYNNYSLAQPRYFCKTCKRYWTAGGTLRNVPVGGGLRKNKRSKLKALSDALLSEQPLQHQQLQHLSREAVNSGIISGQVPKLVQKKALPSLSQQQSAHAVVPDVTNPTHRNTLMPLIAAPDPKVVGGGTAYRQFGMDKSAVWQQTMSTASCGNYIQYQQDHHFQHPHQRQHHEDHLHFHRYQHHHRQVPSPLEPASAQVGLQERDNMHQSSAIELSTGYSAKFCKEEDAISGGNQPYDWQAIFEELFGGTDRDQLPASISAAAGGGSWADLSHFSNSGPC